MIKFLDLQKINAQYATELKQAASDVIDSGWFLMGEKLAIFEKELSLLVGASHAIGVANGLDALRLILNAYIELGVMSEGDEVIVPANTYIASLLAISDNNLTPILVEPNKKSFNLDLDLIEKHITPKTKAIMVVHLYGQVCWSDGLVALAKKHNLIVYEMTPLQIKSAVTGHGKSDKSAMEKMIKIILPELSKDGLKTDDEYDAIACGLSYFALEKSL